MEQLPNYPCLNCRSAEYGIDKILASYGFWSKVFDL